MGIRLEIIWMHALTKRRRMFLFFLSVFHLLGNVIGDGMGRRQHQIQRSKVNNTIRCKTRELFKVKMKHTESYNVNIMDINPDVPSRTIKSALMP